jgi:hypothetical protein
MRALLYPIAEIFGIGAACFLIPHIVVWGAAKLGNPLDDTGDDFAYGDWPALPAEMVFHHSQHIAGGQQDHA